MAHKLKGKQYAIDFLMQFEGTDFKNGTFEDTQFSGEAVQLKFSKKSKKFSTFGTYYSPIIKARFPFNELLPSWNVTLPESCGFKVEFRLSRDGKHWTPWLFLGGDGYVPNIELVEKNQQYEDIEVDVDYLLMQSPQNYFQFRISLYSKTGKATPELYLLSISYSNSLQDKQLWEQFTTHNDNFTTPVTPVQLEVPFFSQLSARKKLRGETCCPTCATMVLNYYGKKLTLNKVISANLDPVYGIYGNWPKTTQTLWKFGLRSYVRRFRNFNQVYEVLQKGTPIIASIQAQEGEISSAALYTRTDGHLILIRGMTTNGDLFVNDPYAHNEEEGCRIYKQEEIQRVWLDKGGVGIIAELPVVSKASTEEEKNSK
ncbi:MAG: C39 family peptidase [Candidatus Sumerlaeia bacterium]|nr:C39 family peptidase [Candidatus Sumerlaeia bacterium]